MPTRLLRQIASLTLLLSATATVGATDIYKHTDAEGNVTFSDQPPAPGETAEKLKLRELNTTPPTEPTRAPAATGSTDAAKTTASSAKLAISIASPADETTIAMGPGNVTVTAQATPPLGSLEQLQLILDGEAFGEPQRSASWSLEGLMRGPHDIAVERLDRRGNPLARSESVRIYVLRPSLNQPLGR